MKKNKSKNKTGICKLTHEEGKFVKSHLIPESLTRPTEQGQPLIQYGTSLPKAVRRWSSWYDQNLVIRKGEDILTEFDTWAIDTLRKHKMLWSSWGENNSLGELHQTIEGASFGIRKIQNFDSKKLRLFFLSLLWRAAASNLPEFSEINLPKDDLEQLRLMLISRNHEPLFFYPTTLVQLSTKGFIHNHSPFYDKKIVPDEYGNTSREIPIYRFYFDGLIAHIHIQNTDDSLASDWGSLMVGSTEELVIVTQTYENSFQRENLMKIMRHGLENNKI